MNSSAGLIKFDTMWGHYGNGSNEFDGPHGITVDSRGSVYVADTYNDRIQKFTWTGGPGRGWGSKGYEEGNFNSPEGITTDSRGNVYVADTDNYRVQKFSRFNNFMTTWGVPGSGDGNMRSPVGIATDSEDNVYVADMVLSRIQKFTSDGDFILKWGSRGTEAGQFEGVAGIATDSLDNVYVVDAANNRIQKFTSDGNFIVQWGSEGSGEGQFWHPYGIATDSHDNVYVVDTGNNRIQKFKPDGTFILQWGSEGTGEGQFRAPEGIAIYSGYIFITDTSNSRIQKFSSGLTATRMPEVTGITPVQGTTLGGTTITINGTALSGVFYVEFGDSPGIVLNTTETSATVMSPEYPEGIVDIRVSAGSGTSAVVPTDRFTYVAYPTHSLNLSTGWNFIPTPMELEAGNDTAAIFSTFDTGGHSIWQYDTSRGRWTAMRETTPINGRDGFWIYSNIPDQGVLPFGEDTI